MTTTIKLAKRAALLHLNTESCKVYIDKAHSTFITAPGIFIHDNLECVKIPHEQIIVPITDITKIEIPVSRFTPDIKSMIEIDWN